MSLHAFDWASGQATSDYESKALLVALGALAGQDHISRVDVSELSETIQLDKKVVREILAELEMESLIACVRPVSSNGIGSVQLQVTR